MTASRKVTDSPAIATRPMDIKGTEGPVKTDLPAKDEPEGRDPQLSPVELRIEPEDVNSPRTLVDRKEHPVKFNLNPSNRC